MTGNHGATRTSHKRSGENVMNQLAHIKKVCDSHYILSSIKFHLSLHVIYSKSVSFLNTENVNLVKEHTFALPTIMRNINELFENRNFEGKIKIYYMALCFH